MYPNPVAVAQPVAMADQPVMAVAQPVAIPQTGNAVVDEAVRTAFQTYDTDGWVVVLRGPG
eukprot:COSAG02_NODE_3871_length_6115_cov_13.733544_3_plen_61_part_00